VSAVSKGKSEEFEIALEIAGMVFSKVKQKAQNPVFSLLGSLGPTPGSILKFGGCCGGKSRLTVLFLRELGIMANQITLYHLSGNAQHALVNISLDKEEMIVDPTYGFYYVDSERTPLGFSALRNGENPRFEKLPYSNKDHYPPGDYYKFSFRDTKTANWTKSRYRKMFYLGLRSISNGKIDTWKKPYILYWPQLTIAVGTTTSAFLIAILEQLV
jgi:hypothetical protein